MILVDRNLLVYAHVRAFAEHERARDWLDGHLNGAAPVGLPWWSLLTFLRLVTNPRVFERPETIADAWHQVLLRRQRLRPVSGAALDQPDRPLTVGPPAVARRRPPRGVA